MHRINDMDNKFVPSIRQLKWVILILICSTHTQTAKACIYNIAECKWTEAIERISFEKLLRSYIKWDKCEWYAASNM